MAEQSTLSKVYKYHDDVVWLNNNADDLYFDIKEVIKDKKSLDVVVDSLLLFYPYLLERGDLRRWAKIANRAVRKTRKRKMPKSNSIMQSYILNPVAVQRAKPRRKRSQRLNQREMLEIYFELLVAQIVNQNLDELQPVMNSALRFVSTINDRYYYGKFYQLLAYIFASCGEYRKGLDLAILACTYFENTDEGLEKALVAYVMALCHRSLNEHDLAGMWIDKARNYFTNTEDDLQAQFDMMLTTYQNHAFALTNERLDD